jgi:hypothetical protein
VINIVTKRERKGTKSERKDGRKNKDVDRPIIQHTLAVDGGYVLENPRTVKPQCAKLRPCGKHGDRAVLRNLFFHPRQICQRHMTSREGGTKLYMAINMYVI